jgi:hypothetical protein
MITLDIQLNWQIPYDAKLEKYGQNAWIFQVAWRQSRRLMRNNPGLYLIVDDTDNQVYVGEAVEWRERFDGRTEALREFRLSAPGTNPVRNYTVCLAIVTPGAERKLAEHWLVRTLYEKQKVAPPLLLQNKKLIKRFKAPADTGFSITNIGELPEHIEDTTYDYDPGDWV